MAVNTAAVMAVAGTSVVVRTSEVGTLVADTSELDTSLLGMDPAHTSS